MFFTDCKEWRIRIARELVGVLYWVKVSYLIDGVTYDKFTGYEIGHSEPGFARIMQIR